MVVNVQTREVTLTEDQWIYLQNKLESTLETEEDDKLEIILANIQISITPELATLREKSSEEEVDKAKVLHGSVLDFQGEKETKLPTPNSILMQELGKWIDEVLGDKFTGWTVFFSWDGQIVDMDENGVQLLSRLQGGKHKDGFIHRVRTEVMI